MKKKKGKTASTDEDVKKDDEEQSQRVIETAISLGNDEDAKRFNKLIKNTVPNKKSHE